jgi:hypothetical protein
MATIGEKIATMFAEAKVLPRPRTPAEDLAECLAQLAKTEEMTLAELAEYAGLPDHFNLADPGWAAQLTVLQLTAIAEVLDNYHLRIHFTPIR